MKEKMWAILLHLGSNMWHKKDYEGEYDDEKPCYMDRLRCDMDTWRKITDFLPSCGINTLVIDMGEAVILDSHPELAVEGSLTKAEFKEELNRLRGLGLTVIPKFNFSCGHSAWLKDYAYMVGTETYYRVCEDIVRETIELFDKPEFFHLGLEEEDIKSQAHQGVCICRSPQKKTEDAKKLFAVCEEYGVRPWIWVDPDTIEAFGGEDAFCREIPKTVLLSNWYYGPRASRRDPLNDRVFLYEKIGEWGYEQVPTSSTWSYHLNSKDTLRYCKRYVKEESLVGFMTAPWLFTVPNNYYGLLNDAFVFGNAKKAIYEENESK